MNTRPGSAGALSNRRSRSGMGEGKEWALHCFKAYDIRGIAGSELDVAFAERLGWALASFLDASRLAVGRDIRTSGDELHPAFLAGLCAAGCDVVDLGICTTGALYHATASLEVDGGVMITASHNPPEYNGFKMCRGTAAMAGDEIQQLRDVFEEGRFRFSYPGPSDDDSDDVSDGEGKVIEETEFTDAHIDFVIEKSGGCARKVRVVIDAANAVPGPFVVQMCKLMGVDAIPLFCEWDASFPNHPPDPTRPENMQHLAAAVTENGAEFGIGIDGDGDRIAVVDENGVFIHPDRLLAVFARDVLNKSHAKAAAAGVELTDEQRTIIHDVKCSMALENTISDAGGIPHMMRTGHSFLKQALREKPQVPLAGEMSGHFFFNDDWNGFDDALYAIARLLELVSRNPSPTDGGPAFSALFDGIPTYSSTGEAKVPLTGEREATMDAVLAAYSDMDSITVDGIRVSYPEGWFLCRPSNTEPILVMRAEAIHERALIAIKTDVEARIGDIIDLMQFQLA